MIMGFILLHVLYVDMHCIQQAYICIKAILRNQAYGTAQMQGKWGSQVARKSLVTHKSLSSHMQTTRIIINCTTIGLLYLYCYKPFVINITKEYYSVHFFLRRCQLIPVYPS